MGCKDCGKPWLELREGRLYCTDCQKFTNGHLEPTREQLLKENRELKDKIEQLQKEFNTWLGYIIQPD